MSIKMGSHGGSGDETALISFRQIPLGGSGGEWGSEGPHGNDGGVSGDASGSVTLTTTTQMGIKGISESTNGMLTLQVHNIMRYGLMQTVQELHGHWLHSSKDKLTAAMHLHVLYLPRKWENENLSDKKICNNQS